MHHKLNRIPTIGLILMLAAGNVILARPVPARAAAAQSLTIAPAVHTQWGWVRGIEVGATYAYLGIPFAAPPLGDLRWTAPIDPTPWQGELLTQAFSQKCPQQNSDGAVEGNEDCLYLNVWTPDTAIPNETLPVLVFMHGGGNSAGSTSENFSEFGSGANLYDGQLLSESNQIVVVTIQYRLGALGFLAHSIFMGNNPHSLAGNYGLLDQVKALQWVQDNIGSLGGDPDRVLLFGESAGALDTCMLMVSPASQGLFQRALMQSGGCMARPLAQSLAQGSEIANTVGCGSDPDPATCLRNLPAEALVNALDAQPIVNGLVRMVYGPTIDGLFIPQEPMSALLSGQFNQVPFVIGSNADEMLPHVPNMDSAAYTTAVHALLDPFGSAFASQALALYPVGAGSYPDGKSAFTALATDAQFTCPARRIARAVETAQPEPVYRYFFSQTLRFPFNSYGAFHGLELAFLFQHLTIPLIYSPSAQERALMDAMDGYWSRFAATGDPNGSGAVLWPEFVAQDDPYLELKYSIASGEGIRTNKCDFWDTLPTYRTYLPVVVKP